MSAIGNVRDWRPLHTKAKQLSSPQLSVSWYFDRQMLELEPEPLFEYGPGYVGHELMIPSAGDHHALARTTVNSHRGSPDQT